MPEIPKTVKYRKNGKSRKQGNAGQPANLESRENHAKPENSGNRKLTKTGKSREIPGNGEIRNTQEIPVSGNLGKPENSEN